MYVPIFRLSDYVRVDCAISLYLVFFFEKYILTTFKVRNLTNILRPVYPPSLSDVPYSHTRTLDIGYHPPLQASTMSSHRARLIPSKQYTMTEESDPLEYVLS
jgi:hypothetical protein